MATLGTKLMGSENSMRARPQPHIPFNIPFPTREFLLQVLEVVGGDLACAKDSSPAWLIPRATPGGHD